MLVFAGPFVFPPLGWVVASVTAAVPVWLILMRHPSLAPLGAADYFAAARLEALDWAAADAIAHVTDETQTVVAGRLRVLLQELDEELPPAWEPVRQLKRQELGLAISVLSGNSTDPDREFSEQAAIRRAARQAFVEVRDARMTFWSKGALGDSTGGGVGGR
jgi:hypothetical protein